MSLADMLACLLHQPVRTLEQPAPFTAPIGTWYW